ncbi:MAG: NAD(P)-dependent oxidoreductase [Rhodobacterales bacterium]|nr:MAG: NAD(P)-dependent oxidoreductase [Rhodobacterales bacterium]
MIPTLLSFGHGYSATALGRLLRARGWRVIGTVRSADRAEALRAEGVEPIVWPGDSIGLALRQATHLLTSITPDEDGDPVLAEFTGEIIARAERLEWVGYLSTTGVYGDHGGGWVDETTPPTPATKRGHLRVKAETQWLSLARHAALPLHIFRLAGIYGPGRGPFAKIRNGTARRIIKPGQVFSRIHVDDIAQTLAASIDRPNPGAIYNVCDDEPAPPQDVLAHAAELLGLPLPPEEDFATAEMHPMARSFYAESKRVRNDRIRQELGVKLLYPSYREGLAAVLEAETQDKKA